MLFLSATTRNTHQSRRKFDHTVEGSEIWRSPDDMVNIPWFTGSFTSQVLPSTGVYQLGSLIKKTEICLRELGKKSKHHSTEIRHLHPAKTNMAMGKCTIWRCISYWTWGFSDVVLVLRCLRIRDVPFPPKKHDPKLGSQKTQLWHRQGNIWLVRFNPVSWKILVKLDHFPS